MKLSFLFFLLLVTVLSHAQLTVQNGFTAQQLGSNLAGANINIINPAITLGNAGQYGLFNFTGTGLGLSSGVILSSGNINNAIGPNNTPTATTAYGAPGDPDLTILANNQTKMLSFLSLSLRCRGMNSSLILFFCVRSTLSMLIQGLMMFLLFILVVLVLLVKRI